MATIPICASPAPADLHQGLAEDVLKQSPAEERPRRHGRWSRRCPRCFGTAFSWATSSDPGLRLSLRHRPSEHVLAESPQGTLACDACGAVLASPARHEDRPVWETAPELDEAWDRYSRRGQLVDEWGRSTDREDRRERHLPQLDEPEHLAPRVRSPWVRGRQDDLLDAAVRAYVDQTEGLRDAAEALTGLARELVRVKVQEAGSPRTSSREASETYHRRRRCKAVSGAPPAAVGPSSGFPSSGTILIGDTAVVYAARSADAVDVDAPLFTEARREKVLQIDLSDAGAAPPPPPWRARLASACRTAMLSQLAALYLLVTNALKARGVEVSGSLELVQPRLRRSTPFAGLRHALAAAYGLDEPPEASPLPRNAIALHKLPSGVVLGQIACKPSRSYAATAREPSANGIDVLNAIAAARVGARTYCAEGGRVRHEPGRPLLPWERELVRLVDAGEERPRAHQNRRTHRVDQLAVERLTPEEALSKIRHLEGAPRTLKEAKIALAAVRKALRLELQDRGLIPVAGGRGAAVDEPSAPGPAAWAEGSKPRAVRPRQGAFAGVGAAA